MIHNGDTAFGNCSNLILILYTYHSLDNNPKIEEIYSHENAVTVSMQEFSLRNYWTQCALVLFVACLSEVSNQAQAQLKVEVGKLHDR